MKKHEVIENIIIILNWTQENRSYRIAVLDVLEKANIVWSLSNSRMERKLSRISLMNLLSLHDNLLNAIY